MRRTKFVCACKQERGDGGYVFVKEECVRNCMNTNMCLCMHVCGLHPLSCVFAQAWKWHMLAVGGSAGEASWLAGGESESENSRRKKSHPP